MFDLEHGTAHQDTRTLDRLWFGEMWFPVEKHVYQVQASIAQDPVLDPADLDLEPGHSEPVLHDHKSEIQHTRYWIVVPRMCYFQVICFQKEPGSSKLQSI